MERSAPDASGRGAWRSLYEMLRGAADSAPQRGVHVIDAKGNQEFRTYIQLLEASRRVGAALRLQDIGRSDHVLLVQPTGFDFIASFFGAMSIGAVPIPIGAPRAGAVEASDRAEYFVRVSQRLAARAAIFDTDMDAAARPPTYGALQHIFDLPELLEDVPLGAAPPRLTRYPDIAYIQTTSGATGSAQAVQLTHRNILTNLHAVGRKLEVTEEDVGISWLPLYNILGLLGVVGFTMYWGLDVVLLDPERFMKQPDEWLWAFGRHGGTLAAAPSFAYEYAVRRCRESQLEGLDLSSWRVAMNGGEPVRLQHMKAFQRRFGKYGLRENIFLPVYGLSEATLAVTFGDLESPPQGDLVSREAFEREARAEPVDIDGELAFHERVQFVSVGEPLEGIDVMIVDGHGRQVDDRCVGEVAVRGPNVMRSYFGDAVTDGETTRVEGEWLMTGDLGYIADGALYVVGRLGDRIRISGERTLLPEELELAVNAVDGIRSGSAAVFGVAAKEADEADEADETENDGDGERLVVTYEAQLGADVEEVEAMVRSVLFRYFRIEPDDIVCLSPRSIPKSASGKIRRHLTKKFYLDGILDRRARVIEFDGIRRFLQRSRHEALKLGQEIWSRLNDFLEK